jgi:hypothetical protein
MGRYPGTVAIACILALAMVAAAPDAPDSQTSNQASCLEKANPGRSADPQAIIRTRMAGAACGTEPARSAGRTPMPAAGTHPPTGYSIAPARPPSGDRTGGQ